MQTQRTFIDDLKHRYKHGGAHMKLIFINVILFLLIRVALVFGKLLEDDAKHRNSSSTHFWTFHQTFRIHNTSMGNIHIDVRTFWGNALIVQYDLPVFCRKAL